MCVLVDNVRYDIEILELSRIRMIKRRVNIDSENEKGAEELCCGLAALAVVRWSRGERRAKFIHFVSFGGGIGGARRRLTRRIDVYLWGGNTHQGHNACSKEYSQIKCQFEALSATVARQVPSHLFVHAR